MVFRKTVSDWKVIRLSLLWQGSCPIIRSGGRIFAVVDIVVKVFFEAILVDRSFFIHANEYIHLLLEFSFKAFLQQSPRSVCLMRVRDCSLLCKILKNKCSSSEYSILKILDGSLNGSGTWSMAMATAAMAWRYSKSGRLYRVNV